MVSALWKFGFQVLLWTSFSIAAPGPASCFSASSLVDLVHCFDRYTVQKEVYSDATAYTKAQPTIEQRADWKLVVKRLLSVNGNNCPVSIPFSIGSNYAVRSFLNRYCVLYETTSTNGMYDKGWGFVVVPSSKSGTRHVHISAPHPQADLGTVEQAAAVFDLTNSISLLVAGRQRNAYKHASTCISGHSVTDPTHNTAEPFFDAIVEIHKWQHHEMAGCPPASCGFIQFHGKGKDTCPSDTVFLSAGLGDPSLYTDGTDLGVKRIQRELKLAFPAWTVSLPSDSTCQLTAAKNVGGRYINLVPAADVCKVGAKGISGEFVHIEQAKTARDSSNHRLWAQAVAKCYGPVAQQTIRSATQAQQTTVRSATRAQQTGTLTRSVKRATPSP